MSGPAARRVERVLKRDSLGRVELVHGDAGLMVRRVPSRWPIVAFAARWLARREQRALQALDGLAGVPRAVAGGRSWIAGQPLSVATALPRDFFDRLDELVAAMHARGVCHNDLHKEGNILVGDDGYPAVIDFQLASVHRPESRSLARRAREDRRHVHKHRAYYLRAMDGDAAAPGAAPDSPPRSWLSRAWRRCWKPLYNGLTRRTPLRRLRGEREPRRQGNWPRWIAAVGPRRGLELIGALLLFASSCTTRSQAAEHLEDRAVTGRWESQTTSSCGIGEVLECHDDGSFEVWAVIMSASAYAVAPDGAVTIADSQDDLGSKEVAGTWVAGSLEIGGVRRVRVSAPAGNDTVVGVWQSPYGRAAAYERFAADGERLVRIALTRVEQGRYRLEDTVVHLQTDAQGTWQARRSESCLVLVDRGAGGTGGPKVFRQVDAWYPLQAAAGMPATSR